LLIWKTD